MSSSVESARIRVLERYGSAIARLRWVPLGSGGGFSGARLWRGEDAADLPLFALKSWPETMTAEQLDRIHAWMEQAEHLPFVPSLVRTSEFTTTTNEANCVWDLCRWMPGEPNPSPSRIQLENACAAIAALQRCWKSQSTSEPCPGVLSRLRLLDEFRSASSQLRDPWPHVNDLLDPLLQRAFDLVNRIPHEDVLALRMWANVPVVVQPCVRDLRVDHVLYTGEHVTGIIDYGAIAMDHIAIDLARFLGECAGDDDGAFSAGLAAYREAGGERVRFPHCSLVPDRGTGFQPVIALDRLEACPTTEFVRLLARTGTICSLLGWLRRIFAFHQLPEDPTATAARLAQLIARGEKFLHS